MFAETTPFEQRRRAAEQIKMRYFDRLPIICQTQNKQIKLDSIKYLVFKENSFASFQSVIRRRLKLKPEEGLFFFINNKIPNPNMTIREIYETERDEDGFLYVFYDKESVFGS